MQLSLLQLNHFDAKCHFVFSDLEALGEHYLFKSRSQRSSTIMARWYDSAGSNLTYKIEFFFSHTIGISSLNSEGQPSAKQRKS